jgi:hypothetical protein
MLAQRDHGWIKSHLKLSLADIMARFLSEQADTAAAQVKPVDVERSAASAVKCGLIERLAVAIIRSHNWRRNSRFPSGYSKQTIGAFPTMKGPNGQIAG